MALFCIFVVIITPVLYLKYFCDVLVWHTFDMSNPLAPNDGFSGHAVWCRENPTLSKRIGQEHGR